MVNNCPVCQHKINGIFFMFRPVFMNWTCKGCGSVLTINKARRFTALIPGIILELFIFFICVRLSLNIFITVFVAVFACMAVLLYYDSALILERKGFWCRSCGYDLRGQSEAICPECGTGFTESDIEQMAMDDPVSKVEKVGKVSRYWLVLVIVLFVLLLSTFLITLGVFYKTKTRNMAQSTVPQIRILSATIIDYASTHEGHAPNHALQHTMDPSHNSTYFTTSLGNTDAIHIPVYGGTNLADYFDLDIGEQQIIVDTVLSQMPANVIAHRLGDFVFTYHGMDFDEVDPGLWVVICSLDPDQNSSASIVSNLQSQSPSPVLSIVYVATVDCTLLQIPVEEFDESLSAQNVLRAGYGLAPLPDPATIFHSQPALADK